MHRNLVLVGLLVGASLVSSCKEEAPSEATAKKPPAELPAAQQDEPEMPATPSPNYPTATAAGTGELFFLEEPERGEHVTEVAVPAGGETTMKSAHCELDEHDVVCVPGKGPYRVRQVASSKVVELMRNGKVAEAHVVEKNGKGELLQLARIDEYGDVVWVRTYKEGGTRYSSRTLSGSNELEGCGSRALKLDKKGRATSVTCLQWNGSPMLDASGVARSSLARDARGQIVRIEFFGVDDVPTERHDGVHAMAYKRSPEGLIHHADYLGLDKEPVLSTRTGCATEMFVHDSAGREVSRVCLDADGDIVGGLEGIAKTVTKRDARGCVVSKAFFDSAGQPHASRRRGFEQRFVVNERCEILEDRCHDAGGGLMLCEQGVAQRKFTYDASGRVVSVKHFDMEGGAGKAPGMNRFELRYKYDARGNRIERACYDAREKPVECSGTGAHAFLETYDQAGRNVETRYLNTSRMPTKSLGTSVSRGVFDNYDHTSQVLRENEQGVLISSNGMSKMTYLYDRGHQVFAVLLYDANDNPAHYGACFVGITCPDTRWHALRVMRSERGEVTSNVYFDAKQRELMTVDCATDGCWSD